MPRERIFSLYSGVCSITSIFLIQAFVFLGMTNEAIGQSWQPARNIEIVTGTGAGSDLDRAARAIQQIAQDRGYFPTTSIVLNKTGANSAIAWGYVQEKKGQGEVISISSPPLITSSALGESKLTFRDMTPIAKLYDVYLCIAVKANSPLKSLTDVLQQAAKPEAKSSWALTGGTGSIPRILLAQLLSEGRIAPDKVAIPNYKAAGDMMAALLGGHVDLISSTIPNIVGSLKNGQVRVIAVASPTRQTGMFASIPTFKEQGVDLISTNWRGVIGAPGITKVQIAFWDNVLGNITKSEAWLKTAQENYWVTDYMNSVGTEGFLGQEEKKLGEVLKSLNVAGK